MRITFVLLIYLTAIIGLPPSVYAKDCQVIKVAGSNLWLPMSFVAPDAGDPVGIAYDLIKHVGKKLGIPVEIDTELPWKRLQLYVYLGKYDLITSIYWNEERAKKYLYTESFFVNHTRVWVVKGREFPFTEFKDLIGRVGGIPFGGSIGQEFDAFAKAHGLKLEGVKNKDQRFKKLLSGRNDYVLNDYLDVKTYLKQKGLQDKFVALDKVVVENKVYFAMSH